MAGPEWDHLLIEQLPTVRFLAPSIHERLPQHIELDDLISAGVVGLLDAFNKKVQFKSYAQFRIRGAILDSLQMLDWMALRGQRCIGSMEHPAGLCRSHNFTTLTTKSHQLKR